VKKETDLSQSLPVVAAAALLGILSTVHGAIFQTTAVDPSTSGSSGYPLAAGASALRGKNIDNSFYTPHGQSGTVLHNVNLLTGQPEYNVPLAQISMGKARFPIAFNYSGPIRQIFDADNERGSTSWLGYGWNYSIPFVALNNKGTVLQDDDLFYCNLGQYGGGQLLQALDGTFYVASDPSIIVKQNLDADGLTTRWEFRFSDGVRMVLGNSSPGDFANRTIIRNGGSIVASPIPVAGAVAMVYRWDLAIMDSYPIGTGITYGAFKERLAFFYEPKFIPVTTGINYIRESYIRAIVAYSANEEEIEKYMFNTANKAANEYVAATPERALTQSIFETKYLQSIEWFVEGGSNFEKRFTNYTHTTTPSFYVKRFLDSIRTDYRTPLGTVVCDTNSTWKFTYDAAVNRHYGLKTIVRGPGKEEFVYGRPDYTYSDWSSRTRQETAFRTHTRVKTGSEPSDPQVILPSGTTVLKDNWDAQSACTERFCFISALDRTSTDKLTLEVLKNNGNYFTPAKLGAVDFKVTFTSAYKNSLQLIPWNDNLIVLDAAGKQIYFYEWDGEAFQQRTNLIARIQTTGGTPVPVVHYPDVTNRMKIVLGGDYFLVQDNNFRDGCTGGGKVFGSKIYMIRKQDGTWKDMNERECIDLNSCVNIRENFGTVYRINENTRAMEFYSTNLLVSASPSMFHIIHVPSSIHRNLIMTFVQSVNGKTFTSISSKYKSFNTNVHTSANTNVFNYDFITPAQFGNDYFTIASRVPGASSERLDIFHYNGVDIEHRGEFTDFVNVVQGSTQIWPGGDYFLMQKRPVSGSGTMYLVRKSITTTMVGGEPIPTGMAFTKYTVSTGINPNLDCLVRTHPNAFTMEVHPSQSVFSNFPTKPPTASGSNYATSIYEYDPALLPSTALPFRNVTSSLTSGGRNYYDVTFSGYENTILAKSCYSSTAGLCTGVVGDKIQFVTAILNPGFALSGGAFIRKIQDVYHPWPANAVYNPDQFTISAASRIGVVSMLNDNTHRMEYWLLQHMGEGFTQLPFQMGTSPFSADLNFVGAFKQYSALTGSGRGHWTEYGFFYIPDSKNIIANKPEYNTHLQAFSFPSTGVITYKGSEVQTNPRAIMMKTISHEVDELENPIPEASLGKVGLVTSSRVHDVDGNKNSETIGNEATRTTIEYYPPQAESNWPSKLSTIRTKKSTTINWAANRSHQTQSVSYHKYNPYNNQPLFTKSNKAGQWYLSQSLYQTSGENRSLPMANYGFRFATEPPDATLNGWSNAALAYNQDNASQKTISASKQEFDPAFPFSVNKSKAWRDIDLTLDDDELKRGVDPIYINSIGWEDRDVVDIRNAIGMVKQTRKVLSESANLNRYTSYFYEGRDSSLIATIDNAPLSDVAAMTAEFGPGMSLDPNSPWKWQGTGGTISFKSHSGRYSLKLTSNPGLSTNIKLRGGAPLQYDYIVSAWIYGESAAASLKVQRFTSGGAAKDFVQTTAPAGQAFVAKRWQRYEVRVTAAQLAGSENLFATVNSGDYLTVTIGASAATGVHVDDIVCRPSNTTMAMTAYNAKGQVTQSIDDNNLMTNFEYDSFGNLSASKDDQHRSYMSHTTHLPGEND
jgi:YD repeat-containing protein